MWHKAIWKGHPMRLELTRVGLLVELANHYTTRGAYVNSGMSKLLNLLVIQTHCWRINDLFFYVYRLRIVCGRLVCRLLLELKNSGFLFILLEWIEIRYFKIMRVDFISGQLKFKCTDVWVNNNLWPDLTNQNRRNYFDAPIFWFYEKSLIHFFENVLISMCLLIGLKIS